VQHRAAGRAFRTVKNEGRMRTLSHGGRL
jgi:hypothetical protein